MLALGAQLALCERHLERPDEPGARLLGLDHVVISTADPERAAALYGARLGLDMALDRTRPDWGQLMFFRCGDLIVEVVRRPGAGGDPAHDKLWGLSWRVADIDAAFGGAYRPAALSTSGQDLVANAKTRWTNSVAAFQDALKVQAGVVGNLDASRTSLDQLVTSSQSASGALQAAQAGNQLLALQSQQLSDLVAVLSAKSRADALEQARTASAEVQGQANYKTFSTRAGYQPGNVTMFSGN